MIYEALMAVDLWTMEDAATRPVACTETRHQLHRRPALTVLLGPPAPMTSAISARPSDAVVVRPWRPFSVHEDPAPPAAACPGDSTVDRLHGQLTQHHQHTVPGWLSDYWPTRSCKMIS